MGKDTLGLDKLDCAWAAGIMDGEAHFATYDDSIRAEVEVTLTNPRVLYKLERMFGGSVNARKKTVDHHKPAFRWRVCGDLARQCAGLVLKYLRLKGPEAEAVAFSSEHPPHTETGRYLRTRAKLNRHELFVESGE